ncbi:MAG: MerR family transcriptional regulator [Oscillospiraceae bacterium]|nr:MerR family transcriptional regulator [Oscillospiraceae bacterium]
MFRIGEFSKMSKTTIKTLRYYDEIGLLKPEETDKYTSHRFYSTEQLFRLHRIQELRQIGLSINEINLILSGHDFEPILQKRKAELVCGLAEGQNQLSRLEFILQGENVMNYSATIKELPECVVYSKKMTVPNYDAYFEVIPEIGKTIVTKYPELKCTVPEYCFIIYLDGEHKEKDINIEFCEAVDKVYPDFDDFKFKIMKAVAAVSVMHKGAYSSLGKAYAYIFEWIEENGYAAADNPRESYIDGIWNKENEDDWLTEVQVPIAKK